MSNKGWIGVDLDGTLAKFGKLATLLSIGDPVWPMVERVKQWRREGLDVRIMTARIAPPYICELTGAERSREEVEKAIQDWCELWIGERLPVTCVKDFHMIELWDDRAVQVEANVGEPVTYWTSRVA